MIEFIRSRVFYIQLGLALVVTILILMVTYKWLGSYTNHGETVSVPNLKDMKYVDLEKFLKDKSFNVKISDSSIYILDKPAGVVVEQDPAPNELVKEGRTIYVAITRTVLPQVKIPNLVDVSQRQAEAILNSYGLKVGNLIYKPDLAKDAVLEIMSKGRILKVGDEITKGSVVDLVLGDGIGSTDVLVPQLVNLSLEEALFVLQGSSLNVGELEFDGTITDSSAAKIYLQEPSPSDTSFLKQGESIKLYLRQ
jgi:beta-lactam-binding protein with PASTA domain